MKKPTALQQLRTAAAAWAEGLRAPVIGSKDKAFRALDLRLQRAALRFAKEHNADR